MENRGRKRWNIPENFSLVLKPVNGDTPQKQAQPPASKEYDSREGVKYPAVKCPPGRPLPPPLNLDLVKKMNGFHSIESPKSARERKTVKQKTVVSKRLGQKHRSISDPTIQLSARRRKTVHGFMCKANSPRMSLTEIPSFSDENDRFVLQKNIPLDLPVEKTILEKYVYRFWSC